MNQKTIQKQPAGADPYGDVTFWAYPRGTQTDGAGKGSLAGHVFVSFTDQASGTVVKGMNRGAKGDWTDWGGVKVETEDLFSYATDRLCVLVDQATFNAAVNVSKTNFYFPGVNDCVAYGAAVARSIGLDVPIGDFLPSTFIHDLSARNN